MQHDWIPSTLGHGNLMCRRCRATDLEAAAIGLSACPGARQVDQQHARMACDLGDDPKSPAD